MKVILYVVWWKYINDGNCDYFTLYLGKSIAFGLKIPLNAVKENLAHK